jgi:hypothetical protein
MRKAKTPPPPAPFVWLRDVLPDIAKALRADLRQIGQKGLVAQVRDLRIYDRCRCGSVPCGTFYCVPQAELRELGRQAVDVGDVSVAKGRIVRVETLSPEVDAVLRRMFP